MTKLEEGNWNWKKSQLVTSVIGSSLTGYQLLYFVHRTTGSDSGKDVYLGTKCNADFSDVRFYDAENDVLFSHNIEEINGTRAVFCVKLPTIPTTGKTVWIIYGDSALAANNNPLNTYDFFDQFTGTSLDATKWTTVAGSVTVADGTVTLGANADIQSIPTFGVGYRVRALANFQNAYTGQGFGFGSTSNYRVRFITSSSIFAVRHDIPSDWTQSIISGEVTGAMRVYDIARYGNDVVRLYTDWTYRGVYDNDISVTPALPIEVCEWNGNSGLILDSIYVTKTAATEPTQGSWSSEEEIINFSKMAKYYAIETINLADSQLNPLIAIMHEVISLSDSAIRTIHTRVLKEVIYLGDSGTGFLTHWAKEIIRLGNVAAGAFVAKEIIHLHNGDDPNSQGCDEYGTGVVDEDLDEYGNPVFNVLNAVGNTIRKAIHYKTDTKCKVVTDLAICKETVYLTNSAEEDT